MSNVKLERKGGNVGYKRKIYKFVDGKFTESFDGLEVAAKHAGVASASLSSYMSGRLKKPNRIPANVEYGHTARFPIYEVKSPGYPIE